MNDSPLSTSRRIASEVALPVIKATLADISFAVDSQVGGGGVKTAQWAGLSLRSLP